MTMRVLSMSVPHRISRLTISAARTDEALVIPRAVRPRTPPGVGTPLRANGARPRLGAARAWVGEI